MRTLVKWNQSESNTLQRYIILSEMKTASPPSSSERPQGIVYPTRRTKRNHRNINWSMKRMAYVKLLKELLSLGNESLIVLICLFIVSDRTMSLFMNKPHHYAHNRCCSSRWHAQGWKRQESDQTFCCQSHHSESRKRPRQTGCLR